MTCKLSASIIKINDYSITGYRIDNVVRALFGI